MADLDGRRRRLERQAVGELLPALAFFLAVAHRRLSQAAAVLGLIMVWIAGRSLNIVV